MRRRARALAKRLIDAAEGRLFPEATSADDQWLRVAMNQAVDAFFATLDLPRLTAVEISGTAHAARGFGGYRHLDYPDFDVCAPLTLGEQFDVVICEQVLEHVVDPWTAVGNLADLCRPGGHVVITSPFLVRVHELPYYGLHDYWRFTPRGLRVLCERVGLEVLEVGSWGNRMCVTGNLVRWASYRRWHPMSNEPDVPVQLWVFARKPAGDA